MVESNEAYTSKCDALNNETVGFHETYISAEDIIDRISNARVCFKHQKNKHDGETIALAEAVDEEGKEYEICPARAITRIVLSGIRDGLAPDAPLCMVKGLGGRTTARIQKRLKEVARANPGIFPGRLDELSTHSLRSGDAMFYFCEGVDTDYTRLLGRWRSDATFAYLTFRFPDASGAAIARAMRHVGSKRNQGESKMRGHLTVRVGARQR